MIKHLGIKWFILTAFGNGEIKPRSRDKETLSDRAARANEYTDMSTMLASRDWILHPYNEITKAFR